MNHHHPALDYSNFQFLWKYKDKLGLPWAYFTCEKAHAQTEDDTYQGVQQITCSLNSITAVKVLAVIHRLEISMEVIAS